MATESPKNIRVSDRANEIMDNLESDGYFADGAAAYRTAIFVAIGNNLSIENSPKTPNNKWDTSSIFRNSESDIETILILLFPNEDPIPYGTKLAEAGLAWLDEQRLAGANIWEIISPTI
jgi:hypothetical protein